MTTDEYKLLIREGFISKWRGSLKRAYADFSSREKFQETYKKVEPVMLKQLTDDFDINNCIIIIPVNTGYGANYLWNNREIVDSHCTHSVNLRYILHKMGMKEYNGKSLIDNTQRTTAMFVINDGVVYCSYGDYPTAYPLDAFYITPNKTINPKLLDNKPIFFSGFILKRLKK